MIINHNINALKTYSSFTNASNKQTKMMEKLSSGLRINRASDDSAGLSISEKMKGQIRGLNQAQRNTQDAISLTQVADGGMNEIHSMLQRGRELSVQAMNDTMTDTDRKEIQKEIESIKAEIDNISESTHFNGIRLLNSQSSNDIMTNGTDDQKMMYLLKNGILADSENKIKTYLGLTADGDDLKIKLSNLNDPEVVARVSYTVDPLTGKGNDVTMELDTADFLPLAEENMGGSAPMYNDRVVAHELVHAVMARSMNYGDMPKWFKEGVAEFIHGGDERLEADLYWNGGNITNIITEIGDGTDGTWVSSSEAYSASYLAVRYLHDHIKDAGGEGIKDIMTYLTNNAGSDLDDALQNIPHGSYAGGVAGFVGDFGGNGSTFFATDIDLANADTGAIGGEDADGGLPKTPANVIKDGGNYSDDPLEHFNEVWLDTNGNILESGDLSSKANRLLMQVGANAGQTIDINLTNMSTQALGIADADVTGGSSSVIDMFDTAIEKVSSARGYIGAIQNRLEHTLNVTGIMSENLTASLSRIEDVDMAKAMMEQTKYSILSQASQAMMAQANQQPQAVLQLLR